MNKREAETLVETVLTQPYAEADLRKLVVNIFPDMEPKSDRWTGAYIPEAFRGGVAQYSRLGKVEDAATLERARTLQRNFVARYLNGGRGGELRDAALVAFYADDTADWRFSLVRMDYTLDPERNKVRKELTPARRYSFLVGGDEKTHTAQKQLATLLQGNAETTLGELERAFNIESVTKEFFEQYKKLFLNLKEELDALEQNDPRIRQEFAEKTIDTATFAKRLLGQIVFLYFLQKKGWLGVGRREDGTLEPWGDGPKDFLRRLFEKQVVLYENFFDDLLEPLFYEALARDRDQEAFYSPFKCRIPFLNGGLFEPVGGYNWAETRINLRNETFAQIFDTFDLYNFTVREDEPLDKEVAVDPEMLGKVFENLLDVTDRKSKGAFYTPREIVHYMCQESLINYLDTALNTVTRPLVRQSPTQDDLFGRPQTKQAPLTEDVYEAQVPRVDLEAFVRLGDAAQEHDATTTQKGRETGAYRFRTPESVRRSAETIDAALADIKICDPAIGSGAFPVGMMNEIVRTRLALNAHLSGAERSAYDFKRHAIQESIYGVDIEESAVDIAKLRLWLSLIVDEDDFGTIKPLPNLEYKIVVGNSLLGVEETLFNNEAFETLERLQHDYIGETRPGQKRNLKARIDALIGELTNNSERFDFKIYFSEVFRQKGGFDVVIGNPPWGGDIDDELLYFRTKYPESTREHSDSFKLFSELSTHLAGHLATSTMIVPNTLLRQRRMKDIRNILLQTKLRVLIDLGEDVFVGVTAPSCIFITQKTNPSKISDNDVALVNLFNLPVHERLNILRKGDLPFGFASQKSFWDNSAQEFTVNLDGLRVSTTVLGKLNDIECKDAGINCQRVKVGMREKGNSDLSSRLLYEGDREKDNDQMYWKGSDTQRYFIEKETERFCRPNYQDFVRSNEVVRLNVRVFNAVPKILVRQTADRIIATIDDRGVWFGRSLLSILPISTTVHRLEYYLGLLNSAFFKWLYGELVVESGRVFAQVKLSNIKRLPIRTINFSDPSDKQKHGAVVGLVETMLSLHEQKATADPPERAHLEREIAATDAQIDGLVYGLYGLTEEEIRIVEGAAAR